MTLMALKRIEEAPSVPPPLIHLFPETIIIRPLFLSSSFLSRFLQKPVFLSILLRETDRLFGLEITAAKTISHGGFSLTAWTAAVTADTSPVIKTVSCPPHLPFQVRKDTSAVFSIWSITITALLLPTTSTNPNAPYLITESSFHYSI